MENLTDYEVQQIKSYINSFSRSASSLTRTLDGDYRSKLSTAKSNLSSYSSQCDAAVKTANKTIDQVWKSGWGNKNNINELVKQKGEECSKEIQETLGNYSEGVNSIIDELPEIGDLTTGR